MKDDNFGPSPTEGALLIFKESTRMYVYEGPLDFRDTLAEAGRAISACYARDFAIGWCAALGLPPPTPTDCPACMLARDLGGQFCSTHKPKPRAPGHAEDCECHRCGGEIGRK